MITHYFLHTDYHLALKNQLHREAYDYLKSLSGKVVFASDFSTVKQMILDEISDLNIKHKKCKPLICNFQTFDEQRDRIRLDGFYEAHFFIYKAEFQRISYSKVSEFPEYSDNSDDSDNSGSTRNSRNLIKGVVAFENHLDWPFGSFKRIH